MSIATGTFSAATLDNINKLVLTLNGGSSIELGSVSLANNIFSLSSTMITDGTNNVNLKVVENSLASITIAGTDAAETITNKAASVSINGGSGANVITNDSGGTDVTITTGDDNDTISNSVSGAIINAGGGSNSIVSSENVTITGGTDNDYVSIASGKNVHFTYGGGSDSIVGFSASSTLKISTDDDISNAIISKDAVVLKIGNGEVSLAGASSLVIGENKDIQSLNLLDKNGTAITLTNVEIASDIGSVSIKGTSAAETIDNKASGVTISAGGGNDVINNTVESGVTFVYGGGNDTIETFSGNSLSIATGTFSAASLDADKNLVLQVGSASYISLGSFSLATANTFTLTSDKIKDSSNQSGVNLSVSRLAAIILMKLLPTTPRT